MVGGVCWGAGAVSEVCGRGVGGGVVDGGGVAVVGVLAIVGGVPVYGGGLGGRRGHLGGKAIAC